VGKDEKTWEFDDEQNDSVSIVDYSEFFVRCKSMTDKHNLGLLFELSVYCKKKATEEETEVCCGWAHLPFHDPVTKTYITNRSYDLLLNGGSVYDDTNLPLDPTIPSRQKILLFKFFFTSTPSLKTRCRGYVFGLN
jgi:hypothetical protein